MAIVKREVVVQEPVERENRSCRVARPAFPTHGPFTLTAGCSGVQRG